MKNLSEKYNEDYYERGLETSVSCYSNFRWIPELTIPLCATIIEKLKINEFDTILDFGSAKGYIIKAMRLLHRKTFGIEISDYAIESAPEEIRHYIYNYYKHYDVYSNMHFDWIIAKDVLEHIEYNDIKEILSLFHKIGNKIFIVVPLGETGKYVVPAYELDTTHIIREPLEWWVSLFKENNFDIIEATYHVPHIKENWEKWGKGNGFFTIESVDRTID